MTELLHGVGKVKLWSLREGSGYIILDDGTTEVFVHVTKIQMDGSRYLLRDQPVELDYCKDEKGYKACNVIPDLKWAEEREQAERAGDNRGRGGGDRGFNDRGYDRGYGSRSGGYDRGSYGSG